MISVIEKGCLLYNEEDRNVLTAFRGRRIRLKSIRWPLRNTMTMQEETGRRI